MSGYTTIALTVIGTTMSVIGQLKQGADAERAANRNAGVLFQNANAARLAANENAKRQRRLAGKRAGTNRALDPDKIDLLEDTALEEELAIQSLVHAGEVEAIGFENRAQSEIARGKNAKSNSVFGAFSSILMGAASWVLAPLIRRGLLSNSTPATSTRFRAAAAQAHRWFLGLKEWQNSLHSTRHKV